MENSGGNEDWETGSTATFDIGDDVDFSRIVILFDDAGAALGNEPASGTFAPEGMLSAFNGEGAIGMWTLFFEDNATGDPLGFHSATLNIEVADRAVPEPATLALFGAGLAGLGFARRRRGASIAEQKA